MGGTSEINSSPMNAVDNANLFSAKFETAMSTEAQVQVTAVWWSHPKLLTKMTTK
jgi:hypothetical protein